MNLPVVFVNSHPIQYFAPLYKFMNSRGLDVSCWYCSDENVKGHLDRQFKTTVAWDIPLLDGYAYRFFKNHSWKPSLYGGFFGLINLGMIRALFRQPKSVIVIHGWGYLTNVLVVMFGRMAGHIVCLRGESPLNQEILKSRLNRFIKKLMLRYFLFKFVDKFLFIGTQNKAFYKYYGVKEKDLVFTPYAVDNERFRRAHEFWKGRKNELRAEYGIPADAKVILFSGKYMEKKRPMDLLKAYHEVSIPGKMLIMVGDGEQKEEMQAYVTVNKIDGVILTGFINQSEIVKYYAVADLFVMCSGEGETWGLSVNEAMNFELPLVVSDMTGCSADLVANGKNGFISKKGDVQNLAEMIMKSISLNGSEGNRIIEKFSFETILNVFNSNLSIVK